MTNLQTPTEEPFDTRALIARLGWYTAFYAVSLVGYIGGTQGLWFWYVTLRRPEWALPGWAFTIVWMAVYGLMATAVWPVWKSDSSGRRTAGLLLSGISMILTAVWQWTMFVGHQMIGSWVLAAVMALATLLTSIVCWLNRTSSGVVMLLPFLWSAYLTVLGVGLWTLNR